MLEIYVISTEFRGELVYWEQNIEGGIGENVI